MPADAPAPPAKATRPASDGGSPGPLSAEVLFGISPLELRARTIADGFLAGGHRSKRFGSSSEFAEHKVYAPGDDMRHMDWRAYGRKDRYYVRRYEEETNLDVFLVVDASGSMAYAGGARGEVEHSKLDYAVTLAAAIAWLAHRRSDGVGSCVFAGDRVEVLPTSARQDHLRALFGQLGALRPQGKTTALKALDEVRHRMRRRALLIVLSDLFDVGADILGPLGTLRKAGADVLLLHTLHRDEIEFRFDGVIRFEDLEGEREIQVDAPGIRRAYLDELGRFLDDIEQGSRARDLRYHRVRTDASPVTVLAEALAGAGVAVRGRR